MCGDLTPVYPTTGPVGVMIVKRCVSTAWSMYVADRVEVHEPVRIDVPHHEAHFVHVRHDEHAWGLGAARQRTKEVAEAVRPEIGQDPLPLALEDRPHRPFEPRRAVGVRQFLEQLDGRILLRSQRADGWKSQGREGGRRAREDERPHGTCGLEGHVVSWCSVWRLL